MAGKEGRRGSEGRRELDRNLSERGAKKQRFEMEPSGGFRELEAGRSGSAWTGIGESECQKLAVETKASAEEIGASTEVIGERSWHWVGLGLESRLWIEGVRTPVRLG